MTVRVPDAHFQKLVSEIVTVLGGNTTEEQRSVVRILWAKVSMLSIFVKTFFLYTMGSIYWVM
jgi:hypothetical protein